VNTVKGLLGLALDDEPDAVQGAILRVIWPGGATCCADGGSRVWRCGCRRDRRRDGAGDSGSGGGPSGVASGPGRATVSTTPVATGQRSVVLAVWLTVEQAQPRVAPQTAREGEAGRQRRVGAAVADRLDEGVDREQVGEDDRQHPGIAERPADEGTGRPPARPGTAACPRPRRRFGLSGWYGRRIGA
jgi:hypothetical protein